MRGKASGSESISKPVEHSVPGITGTAETPDITFVGKVILGLIKTQIISGCAFTNIVFFSRLKPAYLNIIYSSADVQSFLFGVLHLVTSGPLARIIVVHGHGLFCSKYHLVVSNFYPLRVQFYLTGAEKPAENSRGRSTGPSYRLVE